MPTILEPMQDSSNGGHVYQRNFGFMSMVSFSATVLGTWEGVLV